MIWWAEYERGESIPDELARYALFANLFYLTNKSRKFANN